MQRGYKEDFEELAAEGNKAREILAAKKKAALDRAFVDSIRRKIYPKKGKVQHVKDNIKLGADINARDEEGATAMHYFAQQGCPVVCDAIYNMGAKVNLVDEKGRTALHYAALSEESKSCQMIAFFRGKLDVNCIDKDGKTPLHLAVLKKNKVIVSALLDFGASYEIKDRNKMTPLNCAEKSKNREFLVFLQEELTRISEGKLSYKKRKERLSLRDERNNSAISGLRGPFDLRSVFAEVFSRNTAVQNTVAQPMIAGCPSLFSEPLLAGMYPFLFQASEEDSVVVAMTPTELVAEAVGFTRRGVGGGLLAPEVAGSAVRSATTLERDAQSDNGSSDLDLGEVSEERTDENDNSDTEVPAYTTAASSLKRKWSAFKPTLKEPVKKDMTVSGPSSREYVRKLLEERAAKKKGGNFEATEWISLGQQQLESRRHVSELLKERVTKRSKNTEAEAAV